MIHKSQHIYESALKHSGFDKELQYQEPGAHSTQKKKAGTKRHVTWFNPPFSSNVETYIGKKLFNILEKYFPKHHHLHKFINRNTVKLSY